MSTAARITVLTGDSFACVRIVGRANFHSSMNFKTAMSELKKRGYSFFIIELSECPLMDSTFLGVLAGLGLRMQNPEAPEQSRIELLNPNGRIIELLESLGVLHLFRVAHGDKPPPHGAREEEAADVGASKSELGDACLEAHRTLMEINPANEARFKDVAQFLAEDIRKS